VVRRYLLSGHYPDLHAIYVDNAAWVHRMLFARVGNHPDAEDLTAEVFLRVLKPLRVSARIAEVRGYLRATTRTVLAAYWREAEHWETTSLDELADLPDIAEQTVGAAFEQAHLVLDALPETYRRILELRFLQRCSVKDTAAEMGISVANAKVLQHRALRRAAALTATRNPAAYL
jgi:RNA polymerase sigma factor (sigma-70 family)